MSSRIENLGDYNKVRIDLQNAGGKLEQQQLQKLLRRCWLQGQGYFI